MWEWRYRKGKISVCCSRGEWRFLSAVDSFWWSISVALQILMPIRLGSELKVVCSAKVISYSAGVVSGIPYVEAKARLTKQLS